jgi:hypothetical protein
MHIGQKGNPTLEPNHCIGQGAVETFGLDEATWEMEDAMRQAYPILINSLHAIHVNR